MRRAGLPLVLLSLLACSGSAQAQFTANVGFASDYYFRGVFQAPTSASAGLDYEHGNVYGGTWAADVKDGLEVDGYVGYSGDVGDISYGIGFTGYWYTGDFDDKYQEINLSTGYGLLSVDVALGKYDNSVVGTQDYTYYALTLAKNGLYGKVAGFRQDFAGEYLELGYGFTVSEIDLGFAAIFANEHLIGESAESLVFTKEWISASVVSRLIRTSRPQNSSAQSGTWIPIGESALPLSRACIAT